MGRIRRKLIRKAAVGTAAAAGIHHASKKATEADEAKEKVEKE